MVKGRFVANILIFNPFVQSTGFPLTLFAPFLPVAPSFALNLVVLVLHFLPQLFYVIKSVVLLRQLLQSHDFFLFFRVGVQNPRKHLQSLSLGQSLHGLPGISGEHIPK